MRRVKILSADEFNTLSKIACNTRMDCWFAIQQIDDRDYVYDLEEHEVLNLDEGIRILMEGVDSIESCIICKLTFHEQTVIRNLCKKLDIEVPIMWR